ncbi:hypothetical protein CRU92_10875 [Arcobacter sp. FW59]|nr:hypothetical protein CRU92_10875 [Arcobacter sp. FW59]
MKRTTNNNHLKQQIEILKNTVVKVGYFPNSERVDLQTRFKKDSNGKRTKQKETVKKPTVTNAYIASIHEFGSPTNNIPPRPTLGPGLKNNQSEFSKILIKSFKNGDVDSGFEMIGQLAVAKVKNEITKTTRPILKENTVRARLRGKKQGKSVSLTIAKPLVHTGQMLSAVNYSKERK